MLTYAFALGGPWDILIIAGVVVLLFGGSKIAGLGKSLGTGIKEFKNATREDEPAAPPITPPAATVGSTEEK